MWLALHKLGPFRMTMGKETEPQQYVEKNNILNQLDEAFGFMCTHISQDLLFHLEGLRTSKEAWYMLESLFENKMSFEGTYWRMISFPYIPAFSNLFNNSSQNTSHQYCNAKNVDWRGKISSLCCLYLARLALSTQYLSLHSILEVFSSLIGRFLLQMLLLSP